MNGSRRIPAGAKARLRVLATSDLHMHLTSHDYYANKPAPHVGLSRTATLIAEARAEAAENGALALLFDNGDGLLGTPMGDLIAEDTNRPHPLMKAFGHLRYDALGLGNHDFNFGLKLLETVLRQAPCPVVCSNLRRLGSHASGTLSPIAILDRIISANGSEWPIRIGVLSFVPPQTAQWDAHLLGGKIETDDILTCARACLAELRQDACDIIVVLAHSGLESATSAEAMENAVIPLAELDGIDAIIAGHTHLHLPGAAHHGMPHVNAETGAVHGKPVVMPGSAGSHLGVIDLDLVASRDGIWRPAGFRSALRPICKRPDCGGAPMYVPEDPGLVEMLRDDHVDTIAMMDEPVGHTHCPLHSYFTFFGPDRALAQVAQAQVQSLKPLLVGTEAEELPLLSAASPLKSGGRGGPNHFTDIPAGPMTLRNVADLHVFPNELRAVIVTGAQVLDWLETSASLFHRITQGSIGRPLVDADVPGYEFDVLFGLEYEIDVSAPPRYRPDGTLHESNSHRVRKVTWQGRPVRASDRFAVALNSFRASGGGRVTVLAQARTVPVPTITIRKALLDFLADGPGAEPVDLSAPWRFAPMPGTIVSARTGSGAAVYLHELEPRGVTATGLDGEGFLTLNIPL